MCLPILTLSIVSFSFDAEIAAAFLFFLFGCSEALETQREFFQARVHRGVHASLAVSRFARQKRDTFVDGLYGIDMEAARCDGFDDVPAQHEMAHVGFRNHDALRSGQSCSAAHLVKAFDLFVPPADGLNFSPLVDRAGYGDVLAQRNTGET